MIEKIENRGFAEEFNHEKVENIIKQKSKGIVNQIYLSYSFP
jgi:ribosomal protein S17E